MKILSDLLIGHNWPKIGHFFHYDAPLCFPYNETRNDTFLVLIRLITGIPVKGNKKVLPHSGVPENLCSNRIHY